MNALKELLENSIDAGSTVIEVLAKDGGIKMLQITDNGLGISKDDLPILCHRFTTSKLTTFEDLSKLDTYGFRGEALASISHIAHLSVVTKTKQSPCAWKASYSDGELTPFKSTDSGDKELLKPTAGKDGTTFTIEDLFYNIPSRLRALKTGSDEFSKILDVIGRYAVHCGKVGFSCKKFGDSHYFLTTRSNSRIKERIRVVFGSAVANELVPLDIPEGFKELGLMSVAGQITNQNYNNKKSIQPVFFINNRLVSNDTLKRAIYSTVAKFLPKGHKPFLYLSLHIDPSNLDVNVHPTKREVRFLNEDEIIDKLCSSISEEFLKIDGSRNFQSRVLIDNKKRHEDDDIEFKQPSQVPKKPKYEYNLVRVDSSQSKITTFISKAPSESFTSSQRQPTLNEIEDEGDSTLIHDESQPMSQCQSGTQIKRSQLQYIMASKEPTIINLKSIVDLRSNLESQHSKPLTELFANLTYIGIIDPHRRLCSVQYDVKLLIIDYGAVLNELFYQLGLINFGNFGTIELQGKEEELSIESLLFNLYQDPNFEPTKTVAEVKESLLEMAEMYQEYFQITFTETGSLTTLPMLLKNYSPPLEKLPIFLYRLATNVMYDDEKSCLDAILRQLALLHIPLVLKEDDEESVENLNSTMEDVLVPQIKRTLVAPGWLKKDIVEVADLPGLYRVFERC